LVAEFAIVKEFALDVGTNRVCSSFGATQDNTKLVCTLDFANAGHDLEKLCGLYGAIYTESNYTFRCDSNDEANLDFLVYNEYDFPMCVDPICGQTGWRTYQTNAADSIGSWLETQGYPDSTCVRLRLDPDFAVLPNDVPANCPDDTDTIMETMTAETQNLTEHRSAEALSCVSQGGGFDCAIDFSEFDHRFASICESNDGKYLEVDYTLKCTKSGSTLNLVATNDPFCVSIGFCTPADYALEASDARPQTMIDVLATEGYTCTYNDDLVFEDFVQSLSPTMSNAPSTSSAPSLVPSVSNAPTTTYLPSGAPSLLSCGGATTDLIENNQVVRQTLEAIQTEIDSIPISSYCTGTSSDQEYCDFDYAGIEHTLSEDCDAQGGTYIEHTMEVTCIQATTGKETITKYIDRPFCLDDRCENVEMSDFIYSHYQSDVPDADTICPSYSLQEILVGGRVDVDALDLTTGCQFESNSMSSTISILNAKATIKQDYTAFAAQEIRNYCPSKVPGFLDCDFDMSSSVLNIQDNLKTECPNNGGQYLTSALTLVCDDPDDGVEVTFKVFNVPGCVGYCCSPGESKTILLSDVTWFRDLYVIDKGWNCSNLVITSVAAPNYNVNAVCETAAPGSTPTFPPGQADADCENHPVWGCYEGLNHPLFDKVFTPQSAPTFAPTPTELHSDNFQRPTGPAGPADGNAASISEEDDGLGGGALAGIAIGVLILLCLLCWLLFCVLKKKGDDDNEEREDEGLYNDEERQNQGFDDEDHYEDPDGDGHDERSYTTDDWEGDGSQNDGESGDNDSQDGEEYTEDGDHTESDGEEYTDDGEGDAET
jgi:hypothetical protein